MLYEVITSSTCQASNASDCKYGWLYDRTSTDCKTFGCLNNSNINTNGYWSLTRNANDYSSAWYVDYTGKIDTISTSYNVITSYSIHYTKLYDPKSKKSHSNIEFI